ncbi:MAG TPA: tyrosine-type recombinase/integrase [Ktedonobacteraceae bacterium]|nr:tyrosine-type recombinase/integrase [Ktedonobacteraceae bacterium]
MLSLGITCQRAMRAYLRQMNSATKRGLERRQAGGDPLFGSQAKEPLTKNGVTMVCARFRERAGIGEMAISPQVLRHSFALRYLRAGGNPHGLQELLGYEGMAPVRQYLRWYEQMLQAQRQQAEESDENKKKESLSFARQARTGDRSIFFSSYASWLQHRWVSRRHVRVATAR